jgi:diguanylate cyclase (GGDEF)-like protein
LEYSSAPVINIGSRPEDAPRPKDSSAPENNLSALTTTAFYGSAMILAATLAAVALAVLYAVLRRGWKRGVRPYVPTPTPAHASPAADYFERYLRNCVARAARRPSYAFGVLRVEVRGLSALREARGGIAAEKVLDDFADRVSAAIRPMDVLSRLDDDNFAIILDDVRRITDITRVAMRVHESMADALDLAPRSLSVDVAIGVTMSRPGVRAEPAVLVDEAETALQRANESGRPYVVFDERLDEASRSELTLESDLSTAVEGGGGQFSLVYQPLVESDTRRLIGFTAFVQWMHPTRGLLRAADWIALAESSQQMVKIGEWVVAACVRALRQLNEAAGRPLMLTFNVAASEVERGELARSFAAALAGSPSYGSMLRIELPSSAFVEPTPALTALASQLHELGVGIHIDHAAAGSVALWRSLRLGVRGVRINLSEIDATDAPALRQLLDANRQIADEVVVEGIESFEDDRVVRNLKPPVLAQGYQIARPMPLERALELARSSVTMPHQNVADAPLGRSADDAWNGTTSTSEGF